MLYNTEFPIIHIQESDSEIILNSKVKYVIIVKSDDYSQNDNKTLLEKILQSTGHPFSIFQVMNNDTLDYDIINTLEKHNIQKIIVFGIELQNLGLKIKEVYYYVFQYSEKYLLKCHTLSDISQDHRKKQKLWTCLKKMFHEEN